MSCASTSGTPMLGCCNITPPPLSGASAVSLNSRQYGYQPFAWNSLIRQFASFRSQQSSLTDEIFGGTVTFSAEWQTVAQQLVIVGGATTSGDYRATHLGNFPFVEGSVSETSWSLNWYGRESFSFPDIRQFHHYSGFGSLGGQQPYAWDRALSALLGININSFPLNYGEAWELTTGGILNRVSFGSGAGGIYPFGYLSTSNTLYSTSLPQYGAIANQGQGQPWIALPTDPFHGAAASQDIFSSCGRALISDPGWGRVQKFWWDIRDVSGLSKTRYFCAGNLTPNQVIDLLPDYPGSGIAGYNHFSSMANFYPGQQIDPCNLP